MFRRSRCRRFNRWRLLLGRRMRLRSRTAVGRGSRRIRHGGLDDRVVFRFSGFGTGGLVDKLGGVALDEHTLLSHLYLNCARTPRAVGLPNLGGLTTSQGDFLALVPAMGTTQRLKELRLIRVSDGIVNRLEFNACGTQLLQQYVRWHFQFNSELGDGVTRHSTLSCLLATTIFQ